MDDVWYLNSMLTVFEQELTAREQSGMNEISGQPQHHEDNPSVPTATALSGWFLPRASNLRPHLLKIPTIAAIQKL